MSGFSTLDDVDVAGKTVLLRADLNVPMQDGKVSDTTRIERILQGLHELMEKGAGIAVLTHFGRPKGRVVAEMSLEPVAAAMGDLLGKPLRFAGDCIGPAAQNAVGGLENGAVALLQNLRYHPGEETNDPAFAAELATLGDLYVNDAFSCAHRAHASVCGLAERLPAYAGRLMQAELEALDNALGHPAKPVAALVGGAKVSTKLALLGNLVTKVDAIIIGGGMANTFLAARGIDVGRSLCEHDLTGTAREIMDKAKAANCTIHLPRDAVVAREFGENAPHKTVAVEAVPSDAMILDAGQDTVDRLRLFLGTCKTLVWNGPMGAFEINPFDAATTALARCVADLTEQGQILSVAGGGDTVAALKKAGVADKFSYLSTAGGAFLEWLEGKELPGVAALKK